MGCATLNTSDMSPACRDLYNACLNSCEPPVPPRQFPEGSGSGNSTSLMDKSEASACVDECNRQGKSCSR